MRLLTFLALKSWFRASENVKWKSRSIVEFVSLTEWWAETISPAFCPFFSRLPYPCRPPVPLQNTRKAFWPLINVRLRAAKVRRSQILEYSVHCITLAKERKEGKRQPGSRFYTITRLWVVFSLSTLFFATVDWSRRRLRRGTKYELP